MLERLEPAPADKILSLIGLFRDDPRDCKIDLGVGVYRDASGRTPILATVREAERRLYDDEVSKAYLGPGGDAAFCDAVAKLVFGDALDRGRTRAAQTPGGAGALRILCGLIARARPGATVWVPDPTWVNHESILADARLKCRRYAFFDPKTREARVDAMLSGLRQASPGDVVLLHGCCHNPTGASLGEADWNAVCELLSERELLPFVDLAYQGFGDGLEADAAAVRLLARRLPEMLVAVSCSKNFSIYRERTGSAFVLADNGARADIALGQLLTCARIGYSMPPDHGASIVRIILEDRSLAAQWRVEVEVMRTRVIALRARLASAFAAATRSDRYGFIDR
ncbi:MAG: aromatic amino acid transaminase, partial [Burkholderiaceae bacterium]|nr:aromatic amino acid transaminase [Burkholderiaceae bacterium]